MMIFWKENFFPKTFMTEKYFGQGLEARSFAYKWEGPAQREGNRLCRKTTCRKAFPKYGGGIVWKKHN